MKKVLYIFQFLLFSSGIYYLSDQPQIVMEPLFYGVDKIAHVIMYFLYGLSIYFALTQFNIGKHIQTIIFFLIGLLFAASDEFHQSFVPGRDSDLFDWIADAIGLYLSFLINKFCQKRRADG